MHPQNLSMPTNFRCRCTRVVSIPPPRRHLDLARPLYFGVLPTCLVIAKYMSVHHEVYIRVFRPRSEIATESHIQPCTSPSNVGVSLSAQFKEPGAGADLEGSKENNAGSSVDRETGVLSSESVQSIPTSKLHEAEEPIREQNLQEAIRQSRALIDVDKYQLLTTEQGGLVDDNFDTRYFCVTGGRKRKQITFQRR